MTAYYPVFLQVEGRRGVVIGGNALAADKATALLGCGARVDVVAPKPCGRILQLDAAGRITLRQRRYRPGDLTGALIAVCCGRHRRLIDEVRREATARNVLLNVVDEPRDCSFIAPAVVRRGHLAVAISTSGRAPALAVRLREWLEEALGDHHAAFLDIAGDLREPLSRRYPGFDERRAVWYRLVDSEILDLLSRGQRARALELVHELAGLEPDPSP